MFLNVEKKSMVGLLTLSEFRAVSRRREVTLSFGRVSKVDFLKLRFQSVNCLPLLVFLKVEKSVVGFLTVSRFRAVGQE